jgi:hypothetical protein
MRGITGRRPRSRPKARCWMPGGTSGNPALDKGGPVILFFLHIPKTAGSTLRSVLDSEYPGGVQSLGNMFKGTGGVDEEVLWLLTAADIPSETKLVTGHLPLLALEYLPVSTRNFTFLRDPVERTISHYFFLADQREKGERGVRAKTSAAIRRGADLRSALKADLLFPDNLQTRMLADDPAVGGRCTERMLEEAKRNLSRKFRVFGLVERFDESLVLFWRTFNWRAPLYRTPSRVTENRPQFADLDRAERKAVEYSVKLDKKLYEHAVELFDRQMPQDESFQLDMKAMQEARRLISDDTASIGEPEGHDVFDYRVHQLCAQFAYGEERRRSGVFKQRLNTAERQLREVRGRAARLASKLEMLRNQQDPREVADPVEEIADVREPAQR